MSLTITVPINQRKLLIVVFLNPNRHQTFSAKHCYRWRFQHPELVRQRLSLQTGYAEKVVDVGKQPLNPLLFIPDNILSECLK